VRGGSARPAPRNGNPGLDWAGTFEAHSGHTVSGGGSGGGSGGSGKIDGLLFVSERQVSTPQPIRGGGRASPSQHYRSPYAAKASCKISSSVNP